MEDWQTRIDRVFATGADLYRDLFRLSPAPIILEDWRAAKAVVEEGRAAAPEGEVEAWVTDHPEVAERFFVSQTYIAANPAMLAVNRVPDESVYTDYLQVFEARMVPPCARVIADLIDGRRELDWPEMTVEAFDGTDIVLRGRVFIPPEHHDDWALVISTFEDITDLRAREAQLLAARDEAERANAAKDEFLANMSHEFRTPLNAIIGFAQIMREEMFGSMPDPRYAGYIADILQSGEHLLGLVGDILDFAKADAGAISLSVAPIELEGFLDQCLLFVRDRATQHGIRLATEIAADLPPLRADPRRLRQLLLNLLSNAVKFTPPGGRVTLRAATDERGLVLEVADTGTGMAPENVAVALQPFGQVRRRKRGPIEGTGLGLPIARRIAELHGGSLALDSAPGRGTTARVVLPPERLVR